MSKFNTANNREFNTIAELKAVVNQPTENDNFNVVEGNVRRIYNYEPNNIDLEDGNNILTLNLFAGRFVKIAEGINDLPKLPTPKIIMGNNGWFNYNSGSGPNEVLSLNPNNQNRPIFLRLYYEGNDNQQSWMSLPELKYELLRVKPYQSKGNNNNSTQAKRTGHRWVHPSHDNGSNRNGSNYSGGSHKDTNGNGLLSRVTEWDINTQSNKGVSQLVGNNPFTDIEIDPKLWFYQGSVANIGNNILPIRKIEYIDNNVRVSGGKGQNYRHGIQVFNFRFRVSASDPNSWNTSKNRYDKKIYSELSDEFAIYPHGVMCEWSPDEWESVFYEWRVKTL